MRSATPILLLALALLLGACQAATPTPLPPTATASMTPSPQPTQTLTPSATPTQPAPTPTRTPLPTPITCNQDHGVFENHILETDLLRDPWKVRIYLPPCFDAHPAQRYPVLYMLHGQGYNDDQWDRLGIDEAADELIASEAIPDLVIIMPYEAESLKYPGDALYDRAILEVLLPWAETQYPVCNQRECRAIGGLSRGGGWAMRLGFKSWQVFGAVGGHSLTPFGADVEWYPVWQSKVPTGETPRLYIDIGEKDRYLNPATNFKDWLVELEIPVEWHLNPGTHNEEYWSSHVREYLLWYAAGFE